MRRIILLLLVVLLSLPTLAQNTENLFKTLTSKYADQEGFSASLITRDMFDLYIKKRNIHEDSPVFEALKKLDKIMVVSQSHITGTETGHTKEQDEAFSKNVHKTFLNHYNSNEYTLFKTEKRMGEDVKVYLKKNQDKIESLALVTNSSVSTNLIELQGDIDLKTVSELNQALNLRGLENLYKIDNSSSLYGLYSERRGIYSEERIKEMVARQRKIAERQHNLTDEHRAQIEKQAQLQALKQMEMAEKYREMAEIYRRKPIFLSYPGDTNTVYYLDGKKVKAKKIKDIDKDKIKSIKIEKDENEDDKTTIRIKTK